MLSRVASRSISCRRGGNGRMVQYCRRLSQSLSAASRIRKHPNHGRRLFKNAGGDPLVRCVSENSAVYERRHSYVLYLSGKLSGQQIGPLLDASCLCVAVGRVVFFYHFKISSPTPPARQVALPDAAFV